MFCSLQQRVEFSFSFQNNIYFVWGLFKLLMYSAFLLFKIALQQLLIFMKLKFVFIV